MDRRIIGAALYISHNDPLNLDVEMLGETSYEIVAHGSGRDDMFHGKPNGIALGCADPNRQCLAAVVILQHHDPGVCVAVFEDLFDFDLNQIGCRCLIRCHVNCPVSRSLRASGSPAIAPILQKTVS